MYSIPTDNLKMWIKVNRGSVVYDKDTKKVSKILDKTENKNDLVNTSTSSQPIYNEKENYVSFSKQYLETLKPVTTDTEDISIFAVYKNDLLLGRGLDPYGAGWSIQINCSDFAFVKHATRYSSAISGISITDEFSINSLIYGNDSGAKFTIKNKDNEFSKEITIPSGPLRNSSKNILVGMSLNSSFMSSDLKFYELLIFNKKLDDNEVDNVKNYLSNKYFNTNILKMENNYYSILKSNYNTDTKLYEPIDVNSYNNFDEILIENGFSLKKLFEEVVINDETFKPIDKFNNFQLVSNNNLKYNMEAIRDNKQLVVSSGSFVTKVADVIDYFRPHFNVSNSSYIKMAVSNDRGNTWKTASINEGVTVWEDLSINIPLKEYNDLNEDELDQWNNSLNEIDSNGFNISILENLDFNLIKQDTLMFAYVLYLDSYESVCDNLSLDWQFDSKGKMKQMKDTEVEVSLLEDKIVVTPLIDNDMIKVNIINGIDGGTKVEEATEFNSEVIFEGEADAEGKYELKKNIQNYEILLVMCGQKWNDPNRQQGAHIPIYVSDINGDKYQFLYNANVSSKLRRILFGFPDNTHLEIGMLNRGDAKYSAIYKIIGIKSGSNSTLNKDILDNFTLKDNKIAYKDSILFTEEDVESLQIPARNILVNVDEDGVSSTKTLQEVVDLLMNRPLQL